MSTRKKTREQLERELAQVCRRVAELEAEKAGRLQAEQMLRVYSRVIDNSPDKISLIDRQYVYRMVNPSYCRVFGVPTDQIVGYPVSELFEERIFQDVIRPHLERCFAGETVDYEAWFTFPAAGSRYMQVHYYPLWRDGEVEYVVVLSRDITERKRAEQLREEYTYTISHDLRAPVTIIRGHAQILQRTLEGAGLKGAPQLSVEAIIKGAQRMEAMIQDLVDSARLEAGQLQPQKQVVDLDAFTSDLLQRAGTLMDIGRIKIEIPANLPPVSADPDQLERIFTNLLTNALKYSPPETQVLVKAERTNGEVVVSVADRGVGIAPEDLPHIFERFYQPRAGRRLEGLGLGLYITKMLVEAHGGRIWGESEPGKGSTFYFTLPAA